MSCSYSYSCTTCHVAVSFPGPSSLTQSISSTSVGSQSSTNTVSPSLSSTSLSGISSPITSTHGTPIDIASHSPLMVSMQRSYSNPNPVLRVNTRPASTSSVTRRLYGPSSRAVPAQTLTATATQAPALPSSREPARDRIKSFGSPYAPHKESAHSSPPSSQRALLPHQHVLIADDSASSVHVMSQLLRDWGAVVTGTTSARDLIRMLRAGKKADLLIIDLLMPEMNGIQCIETIMEMMHEKHQYR